MTSSVTSYEQLVNKYLIVI